MGALRPWREIDVAVARVPPPRPRDGDALRKPEAAAKAGVGRILAGVLVVGSGKPHLDLPLRDDLGERAKRAARARFAPCYIPAVMMTFEELARAPDEAIDVALGATLIAKDVYDDLDVDAVLHDVAELAGPLRGGALAGLPLSEQAEAVGRRFRELGFHGNATCYYDVENSLLPDVLERRTGIPITLTIVWCEIARRAGVLARGVGFPGHFLARIDELPALSGRTPSAPIIVDPFDGGRIVTEADARRLWQRTYGPNAEVAPSSFEPATSRATLVRMLTNLKAIWKARREHTRAFVALDRILSLRPDAADMLRERGALAHRLGLMDLARHDFERALELEPGVDEPALRKHLAALTPSPKRAPN